MAPSQKAAVAAIDNPRRAAKKITRLTQISRQLWGKKGSIERENEDRLGSYLFPVSGRGGRTRGGGRAGGRAGRRGAGWRRVVAR